MKPGDANWGTPGASATGASFATRLRRYRRLAGLSQEALAERSGVSVRAISGLERGEGHIPYAETVRLLADALGLTPTERAHFMAAARPTSRRRTTHAGVANDGPWTQLPAPWSALGLVRQPMARPPHPPIPLAPLIGRERELNAASAALSRPEARLLTVTGAPGVGKTRFVLQLAATINDAFPDGVAFVDLAPLRDPALFVPTLAQALGVGEAQGWTLTERLIATLGAQHMLLLLDTFEHTLAAAPALATLLQGCDGLTALVTSRAPLRLPGEQLIRLEPLTLPDAINASQPLDAAALATLAATPAIALFAQRARSAQPSFALTTANAASVVALCRRLDGLPLALELAAARVALLPPQATLERLTSQLASLAASEHELPDRPDRQRTLRAALTWSYDLLTPAEQWTFRRLAVFVGGATIEAAEALCATKQSAEEDASAPPQSPQQAPGPAGALDTLLTLAQQSLLVADHRSERDAVSGRLRMLDTIRAYAWERLLVCGEADDAQRAHARYFVALAELAARRDRQGEDDAWETLSADLANLRTALRWTTMSAAPADWTLGLRLASALGPLWYIVGLPQEGARWLDDLLALTATSATSAIKPEPDDQPGGSLRAQRLWAKAQYMAGWLALDQGDRQRAVESLTRSVAAFRAVYDATHTVGPGNNDDNNNNDNNNNDNDDALGDALNRLGEAYHRLGRYAEAETIFAEGLKLRRQIGEEIAIAHSLHNLAMVADSQRQFDRAIGLLDESLAIYRRRANDWGEIGALGHLAAIARRQGAIARAAALLDEALVVARLRRTPHAEAYILGAQGRLASAQGDFAQAEARWQASLAARPADDPESQYAIAYTWLALGDVARDGGQTPQAMGRYLQSLHMYRALTVVDGMVICLERIAGLVGALGRTADATRLYGLADATRARLGFALEPEERAERDAALAHARTSLGADRFALAWDTGHTTPWEHAVALAQSVADALQSDSV